jgi:hypothetical protein
MSLMHFLLLLKQVRVFAFYVIDPTDVGELV